VTGACRRSTHGLKSRTSLTSPSPTRRNADAANTAEWSHDLTQLIRLQDDAHVQGRELTYYSLRSDSLSALGVDRLPYSIKVLLENLLRHEDGVKVNAADIEALARWGENPSRHGEAAGEDAKEIAFTPERVLMQDLTGVPAVVDLASMRDAIIALGGDPNKINPLVPVELVIDHSVILERSGTAESFEQNVAIEYERNVERYTFLKWAQSSFEKFRVVPPGMGICSPGEPRAPRARRLRTRRRRLPRHIGRH